MNSGKTDLALLPEPVVLLLSKLRCWPVVNEGNVGIMITTNEVSSVVICDIHSVVVNDLHGGDRKTCLTHSDGKCSK